jgi:hypothetical protein
VRRALLLAASALPLLAQPKLLVNAQVDARDAAAGLRQAVEGLLAAQPQPAWIAWTAPALRARNLGCDSYWREDGFVSGGGTVHLEGATEALVLLRIEGARVDRIRTLAPDCNIDAGGVPFHWLKGVRPAESVALLRGMVKGGDRLADAALSAIAAHAGAEADQAIEALAAVDQPESVRTRAVFWLGRRGDRSIAALRKLLAGDTSDKVRERAAQALAMTRRAEAIEAVATAARDDRSPHVRGQALFWLAHEAGKKAEGPIGQALTKDPDRDVRRRAVAALYQMPNRDGVPMLIDVARTSHDPEVRKQAMFWLGQSKDPRAVAFFEQVLKR